MNPRRVETVRAVYGAGLLLAPPRALSALSRAPLDAVSVRVARVLGARHLLQALVLWARSGPRRHLAGAAVDAAHAASMLAVARWSGRPARRRLAARNARTAALLAALECLAG